ncbi:MAG TPA: alpha/beta fold hydrolase [Steroidobacteraceae bacterium]|nr:alpha/beta fold hydrolase [Steroidobacteraceae bacterium]
MPAVLANGLTIEYESLGDPASPAIVLIMGLGMQLVGWPDDFCRRLAAEGYRVVRFDNRDCGLSSRIRARRWPSPLLAFAAARLGLPVLAPYSLEDMAKDTLGLMDALGIGKAHVVGASLGGMIAQVLAARFPSRVLSLTSMMSASGRRKGARPRKEALQVFLRRPPAHAERAVVIDHLVEVFTVIGSPGFPTERRLLQERITGWVRRAYDPDGTTRQLLAVVASGDRRRLLRRIVAPTLVIHGTDDPLVPVEAGRDTARNVPGAKLVIIDGMGHDLPDALLPRLATEIAGHCRSSVAGAAG